jgi:2-polyprenyl-3-methyl-5-hydroxy-6-metoxy-1,4-benzoquinol methylase
MCATCEFDPGKAEGFAGSLVEMINHGALCLMISIGHQTGLFDVMDELPASSSAEIAEKAGLNERYVREWLKAMAVGKIVTVDSTSRFFHLPAEHAQYLCRNNPGENIGLFTQYIPVLASVEPKTIACFRSGGGVPYEDQGRFHEVMAEDSGQTVVGALLDFILPLIPGIFKKLDQGIRVLDIGCGSGKALILLAEKFPNSTFLGLDLCLEPLETGRRTAIEKGLSNLGFEQVDLTEDRPNVKFDLITSFDAIHDQARPDQVLKTVYECLADQGDFLMQDIDGSEFVYNNMEHPFAPFLYTTSTIHCMSVSLAQGGMGLGTMWGVELANRMLREAGFTYIKENRLDHDPINCFYTIRK